MKKLYVAVLAVALVALVAPPTWAEDAEKVKFHGEIRLRGDYQNNFNDLADSGNAADTGDQALVWPYRVRLAMEANFTKNVSAWIEIQNVGVGGSNYGSNVGGVPGFFRSGGTEPFPFFGNSKSSLELYQANFTLDKLWSDKFSLTFGRQELSRGTELLLGDNDFYAGFSHDGLTGMWDFEKADVTVWYFRTNEGSLGGWFDAGFGGAVPPAANSFAIGPVLGGLDFYGGYATWTFKNDDDLDVYLMYQDYRDTLNAGVLFNDIWTFGARYGREIMGENGFLWNIEYAIQSGSAQLTGPNDRDDDLSGSVVEAWFGYNFNRGDNDHKVYARYTSFTGDDPNTNNEWEGFQFVAGDFHGRLGKGDWFIIDTNPFNPLAISQGITAISVGYNGFFKERHEFGVAYWDYTTEDSTNLVNDDIGSAFDLWYGFDYTRNVAFEVSISQLSPGDFLLNPTGPTTGIPDDSVSRIYGQARLRF